MKKNVLALSIATMVGGLGFAGTAFAAANDVLPLVVNESGSGHILTVPYYTAQNGNMTVIHLTNTDADFGKAVKVRFRGASNSDDVLDFQVFMSPGDVWTAAVTKGADGKAQLVTADKTCTLPADLQKGNAVPFVTDRLTKKGWTDADKAAQTLEGYIEILNMANIHSFGAALDYNADKTPATLFGAIKHKDGVAPCSSTILDGTLDWESVVQDGTTTTWKAGKVVGSETDVGLRAPTGTLNAQWYVMNVEQTTTYSGAANAILVVGKDSTGKATGSTRVVFSPQKNGAAKLLTADPLMSPNPVGGAANTALIPPQFYDVPDLSTPYSYEYTTAGTADASAPNTPTHAVTQAQSLTNAIKVVGVSNQYATAPGVNAKTDWVFSMPTRRYTIAANYATSAKADEYNDTASVAIPALDKTTANKGYRVHSAVTGNAFTSGANSTVNDAGQICLEANSSTFWDREEQNKKDGAVFSPGTPVKFKLCGEVSVTGFSSDASAVGAALTRQSVKAPYINGWGSVDVSTAAGGVPMLGTAFIKLTNPQAAAGTSGTYGITWPHTYTK